MSTLKRLKEMMNEPSGKGFHEKFGTPNGIKHHPSKQKALDKAGRKSVARHAEKKGEAMGSIHAIRRRIATSKHRGTFEGGDEDDDS